jgi:hypothetical protein
MPPVHANVIYASTFLSDAIALMFLPASSCAALLASILFWRKSSRAIEVLPRKL